MEAVKFGCFASNNVFNGVPFWVKEKAAIVPLPLIAPSVKASSFYGNLVGSMQLSMETKSANATISKNVTRATANITLTLPTSPAVGQEHRVKCFVADLDSPAVVVAAQSGATIEGAASVTLESYGAALSLVWDGSAWMIF